MQHDSANKCYLNQSNKRSRSISDCGQLCGFNKQLKGRDTAVDVQQQMDQQKGLLAGAVNIRQNELSTSYHGKAVVPDKHPVGTSTQSAAAGDCATTGSATSAAALGDSIMPNDTFMMPAQAQHKPGSICAQQQGTPDAAAATAAASAAVSTGGSYRILLGELTQYLQDSTCDVGLQVLWELAEQISADAAAAAKVPVLDLLLLLTHPTAIEACEEAVRAFDSPERASSMRVLRGLLQLLAQPMVAAVLGWGQAQLQQQQQATLKDLNSRAALLAAEVTAVAQRNAHASRACSEPDALGTASCAGAMDQVHTEQQAARAGHEVPAQLLPVGMGARTSSQQQPSASATAKPVEAPSAVHGGCGSCSGLSDAAAQAAAANAAAAAVTKHATPCATSSPPTGAVHQKTLQQVQHMPSAPSRAAALHYAAMQAETIAAAAPDVAPNATPAAAPGLGVLQTQQQQLVLLQLLQQQQRFHMQLQQSAGLAAVLVAPAGAQRAAAVSQLPGHAVGQVAWQWTGTLGAPSGFLRPAPSGAGPLRSAAVAAGTLPQIRPPAAPSSATITAAASGTNAGIATGATAAAAAVAAAAAGPTAGNHSQLTVTAASEPGTALRTILLRWIKACPKDACSSSTGQFLRDMPASTVLVADLLPHIDSLLTHIEGQAAPTTLQAYVSALCSFLNHKKSELQQGCPAFHSIQQKAETAKAGYNRMAQAYSKSKGLVKGRSTKMRWAVAASGPAGAFASARLQCGTAAASTAAVSQATAEAEAAAAAAILTEAAGHLQHTMLASKDTEVTAASTEGTTFADLQQQLQQAGHVDAASSLSVLWHTAQARFGIRAPPAKVQVKPLLLDYTAPQMLQLLKQAAVHVATAAIRQAAQQLLASLVHLLQTQQGGVLLGTELQAERCAQVLAVWQEVQSAAPLQDSQSEVQDTHRPMARSVPSDQMSGPQARGVVVAMQALQQQQQQQQQDDRPSDSTPSFGSSGLTFSALHAALQSSTDSSKALAGYQLLWQFACQTLSGQPGNSAATVAAPSPDATQVQVSPVLRSCMEYAANALEQLQTDSQNEPAHADAAAAAASTALAQTTSARLLLPLLSEPVIMGLLPTQEFHQLKRLLVQLVSVGESAKGAAEQGHEQGTLSGLLASGPRMQQQQQPQQQLEDPCLLDSSAGAAAATGTVDVYAYSEATASVAAAAEPDMSLAALLGQLQQSLDPASSSAGNCAQHLVQLREQATARFQGMNLNDIPAVVVVMNYFCAVEEGVRQVLTAAHALPGVLLAAQQDIHGLLQLAEQPPMSLLLTQSELHSLLEGLLGCRNQITECCRQLRG